MALIRQISAITAARFGVNILEVTPAGAVQGVGTNIVGVVALLPWGPETTITAVSGASLFDTFAPLEFQVEDTYPALKAFLNKRFPAQVKISRVPATGAAASTFTFQGAGAVDSVDVTAKYNGVVGDLISVEWTDNADTPGEADATVRITPTGATEPTYTAFYESVAVPGAPITVNDPGDPFVTFTVATGAPAVVPTLPTAETNLAGGSDGTEVVGDFATSITAFSDASEDWSVAFVAEPPDALVDTINDELKTFVDTYDRGFWPLSVAANLTQAAAITDVVDYRADRLMYLWPQVQIINGFDPNRALVTVQPSSFAAVAIASVLPEVSPGGASGAEFLKGIKALEEGQRASDADLEALGDAGITPVFISRRLGPILYDAKTTVINSVDEREVFRRRMVDFISQSLAENLVLDVGKPLDLDIVNNRGGPITGPRIGVMEGFLNGLVETSRIREYNLDPFSGNLQANIDAGQWIIDLQVKLFAAQKQIILRILAGTTVTITES